MSGMTVTTEAGGSCSSIVQRDMLLSWGGGQRERLVGSPKKLYQCRTGGGKRKMNQGVAEVETHFVLPPPKKNTLMPKVPHIYVCFGSS